MTHAIHPEARLEVWAALDWYAEQGPSLAGDLRQRLDAAYDRIEQNPTQHPPYVLGTRRYLLRRFPYSVVYDVEPDGSVLVLALAHHSRKPGYWRPSTS